MQNRFAIFGAQDPNALMPRLDPIARERRIDPNAPVVQAYLGGRPVYLVRPDPRTRAPGMPADLTVPLTVSRYQHALDIERGYDPRSWEPTPIAGLGFVGDKSAVASAVGAGALAGAAAALGAYLFPQRAPLGAAAAVMALYLGVAAVYVAGRDAG